MVFFLVANSLFGNSVQSPYNSIILKVVNTMPEGGGYGTSPLAIKHLREAIFISSGQLHVEAEQAKPSFCSEATYIVFLKTLILLNHRGLLPLSSEISGFLLPGNKADGHGIWGRWNANGPGVARLFKALGLGPNFTELSAAQPGDFLKIFWTDEIGASEHGHLVIYLGQEKKEGVDYINFWSSNIPNGYGKKSAARTRIHRMIFSRLTNPQAILSAPLLPETDPYLASLLYRSITAKEVEALSRD